MNAETEVLRLLQESGAVLIRQNKHLVYRLPNGRNFVTAKTSSDPDRAARNGLAELRRALGTQRRTTSRELTIMEHSEQTVQSEQSRPPEPPTTESTGQAPPCALRSRIESLIAQEESVQEGLMAEAQQLERRVQMLKALLPFADDPETETALQTIAASHPTPPAPPPSEPPDRITERVQVTRQLVFAATQTFEEPFTVNDVVNLMTGGRKTDLSEHRRIRTSVAQAMTSLAERGELIREAEGRGRQQTVWRKAGPNSSV